ncbi:MAG TPA: branched-chain amino acid ABC transporter permease [Solirubrobacteraceae bacterium]|nr:branched-chain amino acid ABC transporter permease [Solirubrobacteraceae bacterium]
MPSWSNFQPFIPIGLAAGGVYALSGVGMVVLYRATGVLNLAFGAIGAMGALIAWSMINTWHVPAGIAYVACILFGGVATLLYGMVFGRLLAARDPLVKAAATLGLALLMLGVMNRLWPAQVTRSITLPTDNTAFTFGDASVDWTQVIAVGFGVVMTVGTAIFLRVTKIGTAMRALADDREITATLGVPVRRVEAAAWFGSGLLAGAAGLLLADLVTLASDGLTFIVIFTLSAALIARLRSLTVTFVAAMVIGLVDNLITPINSITNFRDMTPFVLAIAALLFFSRERQYSFARGGIR